MADPRRTSRTVANAFVASAMVVVAAWGVPGPLHARAAAGSLDPSFGKSGVVLTDFGAHRFDAAYGLAIQADGKIVAARRAEMSIGQRFALARNRPSGTLDPGFWRCGLVETGVRVPLPGRVGCRDPTRRQDRGGPDGRT